MNTEVRLLLSLLVFGFSVMCFHIEGSKKERLIEEIKASEEYGKAKETTFSIMNCIAESPDFRYYNGTQLSGWKNTYITVIWWFDDNERVFRGTLVAKDNRMGSVYQNYNVEPFNMDRERIYKPTNKGSEPIKTWGTKQCIEQINLIRGK